MNWICFCLPKPFASDRKIRYSQTSNIFAKLQRSHVIINFKVMWIAKFVHFYNKNSGTVLTV